MDEKGDTIRLGSGFLAERDGTLITNYHVIEGASALEVKLANGEIYTAVFFVASDPRRDIAILRIPIEDSPFIHLAVSEELRVGERIYAVGNPLGLEGTLSDGLVSVVRMIDGTEYIQVSAPISPGSSGGPIVDEAGRVLGMATLIFRDGQNLNLAVPSRYIRPLWQLAGAPRPFTASAAPLRQVNKKLESVSTSTRFVSVQDATGVYRLDLPEDDQLQHWIR